MLSHSSMAFQSLTILILFKKIDTSNDFKIFIILKVEQFESIGDFISFYSLK